MAIDLVRACDVSTRLFVPLIFFGLRAASHRRVRPQPDRLLAIRTLCRKPDFDQGPKRQAISALDELASFWELFRGGKNQGLLLKRRTVANGRDKAPLCGVDLAGLISEYRLRCDRAKVTTAADRVCFRDAVLREAGGLDYDHMQGEFAKLTKKLGWHVSATLKDLRHLFATMINNAGMPEGYRRYLMGHSPGKAAILAYTHLDQLRRHYSAAVRQEWAALITAVNERVDNLRVCVQ